MAWTLAPTNTLDEAITLTMARDPERGSEEEEEEESQNPEERRERGAGGEKGGEEEGAGREEDRDRQTEDEKATWDLLTCSLVSSLSRQGRSE